MSSLGANSVTSVNLSTPIVGMLPVRQLKKLHNNKNAGTQDSIYHYRPRIRKQYFSKPRHIGNFIHSNIFVSHKKSVFDPSDKEGGHVEPLGTLHSSPDQVILHHDNHPDSDVLISSCNRIMKTLMIGPGGINYYAYVGALQCLHDRGALVGLEKISGSSAGALAGFTYIVSGGQDMISRADLDISPSMSFMNIVNIGGLYDSNYIRHILLKQLENRDVTFKEFHELFNIELHVVAWNLDDNCEQWFGPDTPNVSVVDAVLASMSVPVLFGPVIIDEKRYMDYGLQANCHIKWEDGLNMSWTCSNDKTPEKSKWKIVRSVGALFKLIASMQPTTKDSLIIEGSHEWYNFYMSSEDRMKLYVKGYTCIKNLYEK